MKKIININFHSRVVPIEETAYEILQQYIDGLRRYFANEEGRDEIISDIENRFSELFAEMLKKGAVCITDADVNNIIATMGRPEDFDDAEMSPGGTASFSSTAGAAQQESRQQANDRNAENEPRRLYRSENDKILGGVCGGLANYLRLDPSVIRIFFAFLILFWGTGILFYIILWMILPHKALPANLRKRLYRNPDDRIISGVASGLAAYFHIEVWIPRLIFALPLIVSALVSLLHHSWFHFYGPVFFTGGFGFTLIITYIVLWIVLPEALTAPEKLEMRGEKVDLESIKNTVRNDLGNFKSKAKEMGSEMQDHFQKVGQQMKQGAQAFASEAGPSARKARSGLGHAIGVLFKVFFLFIAGIIAFALIMLLIGLLFESNGIMAAKGYLITGREQNALLWASFFLFFVTPVVALLAWLIRRITGVRSRTHYLGYVFATLWIIGLFSLIGLAVMVRNNFLSKQHTEENIDLVRPSRAKLIIRSMEKNDRYDDNDSYIDDLSGDDGFNFSLNRDSLFLNTVRIIVVKSEDTAYHAKVVKFSHGGSADEARRTAANIRFSVRQADSNLYLPYGFPITSQQKFRNQQVLVIVAVPVGRHILLNGSLRHYGWFNINLNHRHIHWPGGYNDDRTDGEGSNYDNLLSWDFDTEYVMTREGQLDDVSKPQTGNSDSTAPGKEGYRYKHPADREKSEKPERPEKKEKPEKEEKPEKKEQPENTDGTKRSARLQTSSDTYADTYFLSSLLFQ